MVYQAKVKGFNNTFTVLVDSGATANFVSRKALLREQSAFDACDKRSVDGSRRKARLADGALIDISMEQVGLKMSFLDFDSLEWMFVIDMNYRFDIILGMPWLRKHEPWIEWKSGEMGSSQGGAPTRRYNEYHSLYASDLVEKADDENSKSLPVRRSVTWKDSMPGFPGHEVMLIPGRQCDDLEEGMKRSRRGRVDHLHSRSKECAILSGDDALSSACEIASRGSAVISENDALFSACEPKSQGPAGVVHETPHIEKELLNTGVRRTVEFELSEITDLPKVATELLTLEVLEYEDFLTELQSGEIEDIAVITRDVDVEDSTVRSVADIQGIDNVRPFVDTQESNTVRRVAKVDVKESTVRSVADIKGINNVRPFVDTQKSNTVRRVANHEINTVRSVDIHDGKKARFQSQSWEAMKDNPCYEVLKEFEDVFPNEVPARLPKDRGIRHEISNRVRSIA